MSMFNLDRFRFDKSASASVSSKEQSKDPSSPESEKENKPAMAQPARSLPKPSAEGVVFLDTDSDENDDIVFVSEVASPSSKHSSSTTSKKLKHHSIGSRKDSKESSLEDKINKLLAMFPQLTRSQAQEVAESTSTLEGAVATCLLRFGDKEQGTKRKMDGSSSSQSSDAQPTKKRKPLLMDLEVWEKQEAMVKRLQRKFPDQDKEELRSVLEEHNWEFTEALQALQMFSEPENGFGSQQSKEKRRKSPNEQKRGQHKDISDSEDADDSEEEVCDISGIKSRHVSKSTKSKKQPEKNELKEIINMDSDCTIDSSDFDSESDNEVPKLKTRTESTLLHGDQKDLTVKPNAEQSNSKPTSVISLAKAAAAERKERAKARVKHDSSGDEDDDEDEDEEIASSGLDDSDEELETKGAVSGVKLNILNFFNDSTIDELNLISGCSVKKAQKIIELRPFESWDCLVDLIHKGNGLSEDLLLGCKSVLKERKVVLGLMSKCETISSNLIKQVTEVTDSGAASTTQPELLNNDFQLKPYQLIGLKWLLLLHKHKLSCILADEMGLGKTIQAIAFLAQLYENGIRGPHLITVPASTLDNWVRELKMWCPTLNVIVYYGSAEDRRYLKYEILNDEIEFDVIVTTYNLAIGNDSDRSLFRKLKLAYAIFDEGHMLKNMNTLRYRHLMAINAKHRLLLTGTPLQNNLLELMSLLNFIMPSMFSDSTTQLSKMFSMKSHEEQSIFERQRISQAKRIMKPFILRRVKNEVLKQLPAKEEKVEHCPMSDKQEELYKELFKKLKETNPGEKRDMCNVMMQLRKMANHPLLHRHHYTTEKLKAMSRLMLKDMEVMSDFELHCLCKQYNSISSYQLETSILLDSGKFKHLTQLLNTIKDEGDRVVLFSQFTMMLDIVEVLLKHLKYGYVRLDGSTPIADRILLIDKYNTDRDIFIFLLSTKAGGLGINLTSANVVILHDIDCNPYNDKQAEDRCHRVGQTKTVQVIKLISKDTIEANILQLGQKKLKLEQDMTAADETVEGTIPEDMATLLKATLGL